MSLFDGVQKEISKITDSICNDISKLKNYLETSDIDEKVVTEVTNRLDNIQAKLGDLD
ncbi:hypothetical protein QJU96_09530 [Pasteurella skyensis]|uniref:Uncharacterized protein n=1 Tax=Phocoenobacter skyensis TaxID=97481 RepID=A0AAJ6NER9_9PAST|nr:hypothetical protein [Pasteurella skyensis]MDP8171520.1 hypothetical protein [Pasteurella skyensis]MDP8175422.1 hypothetical protein [Pasteurella skyensis]